MLRVSGREFEPEVCLVECNLDAYSIFSKGDKLSKSGEEVHSTSGFKVAVSESEWSDRDGQFQDALEFLRKYSVELRRLTNWDAVEEVVLDFPFSSTGVFTYIRFPIELTSESSALGIALEISVYPIRAD